MRSYRSRDNPLVLQIAQVCFAWTVLGAILTLLALSASGTGAIAVDPSAQPPPEAIERAVLEAESQANLVQSSPMEQR